MDRSLSDEAVNSETLGHHEETTDEHMEAEFTVVKNKRKRRQGQQHKEKNMSSDEEDSTDRDNKKVRNKETCEGSAAVNEKAARGSGVGMVSQAGGEGRPESGRGGPPASPNNRVRLLFPNDTELTYHEKLLWTVKLGRAFRRFEPLLKEGKYRPYVTVGSQEAVEFLTTSGYEGVVLQLPEEREKLTKVIIFRYPLILDPEFLLDDTRFTGAKRHVVRGEERTQVTALVKGEVPDKVFITGAGYRKVVPYVEPPSFCLRCSRWGHKTWTCQEDARCRFCAKKHPSSVCAEKIKNNERVIPRCCNCGGEHNARYPMCPRRPAFLPSKRTGEIDEDRSNRQWNTPIAVDTSPPPPPPQQQGGEREGGESGGASSTWPLLGTRNQSQVKASRHTQADLSADTAGRLLNPTQAPAPYPRRPPYAWSQPPSLPGHQTPRTLQDDVGEILNYVRHLEEKIDAIDKRVNAVLEQGSEKAVKPTTVKENNETDRGANTVVKQGSVKAVKPTIVEENRETDRGTDTVVKQGSVRAVQPTIVKDNNMSATCDDNDMCISDNPTKRQSLITIDVDFETLLRKWENSGRDKSVLVETWSDMQHCIEKARCILDKVSNVDNADASVPKHG